MAVSTMYRHHSRGTLFALQGAGHVLRLDLKVEQN